MQWRTLDSGNLEISWTHQEKEDFLLDNYDVMLAESLCDNTWVMTDEALYIAFESVVCNGLSWIAPEDIGALTDAPILGEVGEDEQGEPIYHEVWWYPSYDVRSPVQDLCKNLRTVFPKAEPN
jgi:hypothetical protein